MNFSTNQVLQLLDVTGATPKYIEGDGYLRVGIGEKVSDYIRKGLVKDVTLLKAGDDTLRPKAVLIELNPDINGGDPMAGQDYAITITYRDAIDQEGSYHKFGNVHAVHGMTPAKFYEALALDLWCNRGVEEYPLYDLYDSSKTLITAKSGITDTTVATGFYIVESSPYWKIATFPERLMYMELATAPVNFDGDAVNNWLKSYKFEIIDGVSPKIYNAHKMADLEYFVSGEEGNSSPLANWPDNIDPGFTVDSDAKWGYSVLTVRYAYQGPNVQNTFSERDLLFIEKADTEGADPTVLNGIKDKIETFAGIKTV